MTLCLNFLAALLLAQESKTVRVVESADGAIEMTVTETACDGTSKTSTYRASSAEEFRTKHPELAKEHGVGKKKDLADFFKMPWSGAIFDWIAPPKPLGVKVTTLSEALKAQLDVEGLLVAEVEGRAAEAGLKKHDVLLKINGAQVGTPLEFRAAVRRQGSGEIRLEILRQGKRVDVTVKGSAS